MICIQFEPIKIWTAIKKCTRLHAHLQYYICGLYKFFLSEIIQKVGKRKKCIHLQNLKEGKIYGVKIQYKLILTRDSTHLPKKRPFLLSLIDPITSSEQVESTKNPAHAVECQVSRHSCGSNGDWQTGKVTQASQVGQRGKLCVSLVCVCLFVCCVCVLFESAPVFWS